MWNELLEICLLKILYYTKYQSSAAASQLRTSLNLKPVSVGKKKDELFVWEQDKLFS